MANALFAGASIGLVVLPLMIFHQLQLMACAALARRYARGGTLQRDPQAISQERDAHGRQHGVTP
jgi:sodium/bile acid cotransporter 7